MVACASCKNRTSNERCTNTALSGLSLCGRHAKVRSPRLWHIVNNLDAKVVLISKQLRGYLVRRRLQMAGIGVLKRSLCHNSDELVSLEPISTVDCFNYFGFEESGKIYGFDVRTILDTLHRNLVPINPYTRQPLTIETRKRLRDLYSYRVRHKLDTSYEHNSLRTTDVILTNRWTQLCQIVEENGFFNTNPNLFLGLNKSQLHAFLAMIHNDLKTWAAEHKPPHSKRFLYVFWSNNILKKYTSTQSIAEYSFFVSSILLSMLYDSVEPYSICFIIMSALYRL